MSDLNSVVRFLQQENARLKEENERLTEEVRALLEYILAVDVLEQATRSLSDEHDLMNLLDKTLAYALGVLSASDASLLLTEEETGDLVFALVHGQKRQVLPGYRIRKDEGIAGWVAAHGKPVIVNDARRDPRFSTRVDEAFNFHTNSLICVPLLARQKTLGVIEVVNKAGGEFTDTDVNMLSILALVSAIALDDVARQSETNSNGA